MKKFKEIITSMFSDSEWDADMAKIIGFILIVIGVVGFFTQKDGWQWLITAGAALIGWKSKVEGL